MTQEEYEVLNKARRAKFKEEQRAIAESLSARKAEFKQRTQELLAEICHPANDKTRLRQSYDIQRAIKARIDHLDDNRGWDVHNAEVKFNNQGDMLLLEVAIPKTQQQ